MRQRWLEVLMLKRLVLVQPMEASSTHSNSWGQEARGAVRDPWGPPGAGHPRPRSGRVLDVSMAQPALGAARAGVLEHQLLLSDGVAWLWPMSPRSRGAPRLGASPPAPARPQRGHRGCGRPAAHWCPLRVSTPQKLQPQPASPQGSERRREEGPCPGSHGIHGG